MPKLGSVGLQPGRAARVGRPSLIQPDTTIGAGQEGLSQVLQAGAQALSAVDNAVLQKTKHTELTNQAVQWADLDVKGDAALKEISLSAIPDEEGGELENPQGEDWDERFRNRFDAEVDKLGQGLTTDAAREYYQKMRSNFYGKYGKKLSANRQAVAQKKATLKFDKFLKDKTTSAFNSPETVTDDAVAVRDTLNTLVDAGFMAPVDADERFQKRAIPELGMAAVGGRMSMAKNVSQLEKLRNELVDGKRWDEFINGKQKQLLTERIDTRIRSHQGQAASNLRDNLRNPYKVARKAGRHPGILNFKTATLDDYAGRKDFRDTFSAEINNPGMSLLDPIELDQIDVDIDSGSADDGVEMLENMAKNTAELPGRETGIQRGVGNSLIRKWPTIGVAYGTVEDDPSTVRTMLLGRNFRKKKGSKFVDTSVMDRQFDTEVPTSLMRFQPELRAANRQAINDTYIGLRVQDNESTEVWKQKTYEKAVRLVLGPELSMGGRPFLSYRQPDGTWTDKGQFSDTFSQLTDSDLNEHLGGVPLGTDGEPMKFEKSRGRLTLETAGAGRYFLVRDGEEIALNKKGVEKFQKALRTKAKPKFSFRDYYILDMKKINEGFTPKTFSQRVNDFFAPLAPDVRPTEVEEAGAGFGLPSQGRDF